jgi:hypothetical protein
MPSGDYYQRNRETVLARQKGYRQRQGGALLAKKRLYYSANRERILSYQAERRSLVAEVKSQPCTDCHKRYPPHVMDFDHLPERGQKLFNIGQGMSVSMPRLVAEIEKCEIVCANCHRIREYDRRNQ